MYIICILYNIIIHNRYNNMDCSGYTQLQNVRSRVNKLNYTEIFAIHNNYY